MSMDTDGSGQLLEIFKFCDKSGEGTLNNEELLDLCQSLQLSDCQDVISHVHSICTDTENVTFDEFKIAFVSYLSQLPDFKQSPGLQDEFDPENEKRVPKSNNNSSTSVSPISEDDAVSPSKRHRCRSKSVRPLNLPSSLLSEPDNDNTNCSVDIEDFYWSIWSSLGIGDDGFLSPSEFEILCNHVFKDKIDSDIKNLFHQLDQDGDGKISFQEFILELITHRHRGLDSPDKGSPPNKKAKVFLPSLSIKGAQKCLTYIDDNNIANDDKVKEFDDMRNNNDVANDNEDDDDDDDDEHCKETSIVHSLFSSISHDSSGIVSPEKVINFWEGLEIGDTTGLLIDLGFDLNTKINLQDLSGRLDKELSQAVAESSSFALNAAFATYQQELQHLRSLVDHLMNEREKLRKDLSNAVTRNNFLIHEVDEQQEAIQNHAEERIRSAGEMYEKRIKALQEELQSERENIQQHMSRDYRVTQDEFDSLVAEEQKLRNQLVFSDEEIVRLEKLLDEEKDKSAILERTIARLDVKLKACETVKSELMVALDSKNEAQREDPESDLIQQIELQNKKLRDDLDEKSVELEELRHKIVMISNHKKDLTFDGRGSPLLKYLRVRHSSDDHQLVDTFNVSKYENETSYDFNDSFDFEQSHFSGDYGSSETSHHRGSYGETQNFHYDYEIDLINERHFSSLEEGSLSGSDLQEQLEDDIFGGHSKDDELMHVRLLLATTQERNLELIDTESKTRSCLEDMKCDNEALTSKLKDMEVRVGEDLEKIQSYEMKMAEHEEVTRSLNIKIASLEGDLSKCNYERSKAVTETSKVINQNISLKHVISLLRETALTCASQSLDS